jgi:threonine dehydratase
MKQLSPQTQVVAVEPEGLDDMKRSLAAGHILANDPNARSICDALLTPSTATPDLSEFCRIMGSAR